MNTTLTRPSAAPTLFDAPVPCLMRQQMDARLARVGGPAFPEITTHEFVDRHGRLCAAVIEAEPHKTGVIVIICDGTRSDMPYVARYIMTAVGKSTPPTVGDMLGAARERADEFDFDEESRRADRLFASWKEWRR